MMSDYKTPQHLEWADDYYSLEELEDLLFNMDFEDSRYGDWEDLVSYRRTIQARKDWWDEEDNPDTWDEEDIDRMIRESREENNAKANIAKR